MRLCSSARRRAELPRPGGARRSYAELADDVLLEREATARAKPKAASEHRIVGTPLARLDLPDKVYGRPRFVHDLELPGMLHARVLRPPSPDATLVSLDTARALRIKAGFELGTV